MVIKTIPHNFSGLLIYIEGPDLSGKGTLAFLLADRLTSLGYTVRLTKEPQEADKSIFGGTVRRIYQNKFPWDAINKLVKDELFLHMEQLLGIRYQYVKEFQLLAQQILAYETNESLCRRHSHDVLFFLQLGMLLDRLLHHRNVIIPEVRAGKIVISDRCWYSTFAYAKATDIEWQYLAEAHNNCLEQEFIRPDRIFLLDVTLAQWRKRKKIRSGTEDIFESEEFFKKIRTAYKDIAQFIAPVPVVIDTNHEPENALVQTMRSLQDILKQ